MVVRPILRANNGDVLRSAALDGVGVALQPTFVVGEDLSTGKLFELLPAFRSRSVGVYGVYPTRRHVPAKTRALLKFLQSTLGEDSDSAPWDLPNDGGRARGR